MAIILLGVTSLASSAFAGGGDVFTLDENDGAMMNTFRDITALPTLPPGAINPATGSPFTTTEELGGLTTARMAGGFGIPAMNALSTLAIGGTAIYTAYELGDYFRSKIVGDKAATVSPTYTPVWKSYGNGAVGDNGSSTGFFTTSASWSLGNFGGWGASPGGGVGSGFGVCPQGCWVLYGRIGTVPQIFCADGIITANCTGGGGTTATTNDPASNATVASIISNNPTLTNVSYNTTAGSTDCKTIGACMLVWRTFDQQRRVVSQESCNVTCFNAANINHPAFVPSATNGGNAANLQNAEQQCGGFLGTTVGNPDQEACRAALNYEVNPACTSGCTGTSTPTVTIPGTVSVSPFAAFNLPAPSLDESYSDYLEELRAKGWIGTVTINDEDTSLWGSTVAGRGVPDGTLVGAQVGVTSPVYQYEPLTGDQNSPHWPDNAPEVETPTDTITLIKTPTGTFDPSAPTPTELNCDTCAIDWTPLYALSVGTKFPFGIPAWIEGFFGGLSFSDTCTQSLDLNNSNPSGSPTINVPFCSAAWESTYRPIVFPILEALLTLAAVIFMATKILGYGGQGE